MNFVDVQPKSFLDYAWTSPSPATITNAKASKTTRKQNRCCDQCRKGKRACDAAILEDTLLDKAGSSGDSPTVFHYSDVFGPLAACGNCEKTKKACTFEWLRSQRVSQATPQPSTAPPAKRRRKSNTSTSPQATEATRGMQTAGAPQPTPLPDTTRSGGELVPHNGLADFGVTFADFPAGIPAFDTSESILLPFEASGTTYSGATLGEQGDAEFLNAVLEENDTDPLDRDSGKGSSLDTSSEGMDDSLQGDSPTSQNIGSAASERSAKSNGPSVRIPRKRRRRSSSSMSSNIGALCTSPSANNFLSSANSAFLAEGLLKIYHDSFENALSCWLTERTCPYSKSSDVALIYDNRPDWNRIYHRVFRLDRLATPIRGRGLTFREDKTASRALNLAIFSFATQWAQSSQRSSAKYPYQRDGSDDRSQAFNSNAEVSSSGNDFDRALQVSAWHEARMALQDAAGVESFRVVLAQIVFSLTQRPAEPSGENVEPVDDFGVSSTSSTPLMPESPNATPNRSEEGEISDCEDLLSKLSLTMDGEGPPIHLEQGLRLIHSLRSRVAMSGTTIKSTSLCAKQSKLPTDRLSAGDRATVDLLFWLGVMFDTLSSAMHKRPLVVSDEDSDIFEKEPKPTANCSDIGTALPDTPDNAVSASEGIWDDYLFAHQHDRINGNRIRWPCSFDQAASLLCDAAPVKVLLFRKVTRIQTLLSRKIRGERIEKAVEAALDVYRHWVNLYAPFIGDCIENHDSLPPRVQSWYICLTGHWHLATLLLADLIEIIDDSEFGVEAKRQQRTWTNFLALFRERNCQELSDIAKCACPREDASFAKSGNFHFAVNQGALLTEPWTEVLIRAFAKAGVVLLESESSPGSDIPDPIYQEDAFRRADACVKALWYLGRKSDMALAAARILGAALKQRRKGVEEKVNDMSAFLEVELWEGFEEIGGAFGVECE